LPAWSFVRATLLNGRSPACFWRHPAQAVRVLRGAAVNFCLVAGERLAPGHARSCPVCGWEGRRFRTFLSADEVIPGCICPGCGSFDRQRLLVLGLRAHLLTHPGSRPQVLLGFSLSAAVRLALAREGLPRCFRSGVRDGIVDWLFCSHVLEHVVELDACLDEMARMLAPGGLAWIQVPLEPGLVHSRPIPVDPHRAHAHAWQFGVDFGELLARPAWEVREVGAAKDLTPAERKRHGIQPDECYWLLIRR
jgi:hypothetical protein